MKSIGNYFEHGSVCTISDIVNLTNIDFQPHAKFKGVSLKPLVTGKMTNNQISCHLVKVDPFCTLNSHTHPDNLEIHEVISGEGTCYIAENKVTYNVGIISVIPSNVPHKVEAGENGLYILAKFTPALV